jgi:hypothetical protein
LTVALQRLVWVRHGLDLLLDEVADFIRVQPEIFPSPLFENFSGLLRRRRRDALSLFFSRTRFAGPKISWRGVEMLLGERGGPGRGD